MTVIVQSAYQINKEQKKVLDQKISELSPDVTVEYQIDRSLIAGLRIITPSRVIDQSLSAKLSNLSKNLR